MVILKLCLSILFTNIIFSLKRIYCTTIFLINIAVFLLKTLHFILINIHSRPILGCDLLCTTENK